MRRSARFCPRRESSNPTRFSSTGTSSSRRAEACPRRDALALLLLHEKVRRPMNCLPVLLFVALLVPGPVGAQERAAPAMPITRYGADPTAGRTFDRDGVRLYFEV